jgi:hypothetical protein
LIEKGGANITSNWRKNISDPIAKISTLRFAPVAAGFASIACLRRR